MNADKRWLGAFGPHSTIKNVLRLPHPPWLAKDGTNVIASLFSVQQQSTN